MSEHNKKEVNLDELMRKIREEVASLQSTLPILASESNSNTSIINLYLNQIESSISWVDSKSAVRTKWPDKLNKFPFTISKRIQKLILKSINFLFKDQRQVNLSLSQSLRASVVISRHLLEQNSILNSQLNEQTLAINSRLQSIEENSVSVRSRFKDIDKQIVTVNSQFKDINEQIITVASQFKDLEEPVSIIDGKFQVLGEHLGIIDDQLQEQNDSSIAISEKIYRIQEDNFKNNSCLKTELMQHHRSISIFLEEAMKRESEPFNPDKIHKFSKEKKHLLDSFYVAFEDEFRGTTEDISNRLNIYLPIIEDAKIGNLESPILDVGSGRGEWLKLLNESRYIATGIDTNRVMIERCQATGLNVIESDVIEYLRLLPDNCLGAVTGFHIIEHLSFEVLLELFDETQRVLKPNGLFIFETPNPENVLVGSNTFYLDPTHRNPLPSSMIKFVAESRGFSRLTIKKLHPYPENMKCAGSELAERFNDHFYGEQDYAIIGYKHE